MEASVQAFRSRWGTESRYFMAFAAAALALGVVRRIGLDWTAPLWLDETFTGAFALSPNAGQLLSDLGGDVGAPLYYSVMWAWEKLFGAGNFSLRAPSLIAALATPLVVLRFGPPDRGTRWLWSVLLFLWLPGFYYASEARGYALLFLFATVQAILYTRLMAEPTLRRAWWWAIAATITGFTHYHSLLVTALQGLFFLLRWRGAALRTWSAALAFLPLALWLAHHFPLLSQFSDPRYAWQPYLTVEGLPLTLSLIAGMNVYLLLVPGLVLVGTIGWDIYRRLRSGVPVPYPSGEAAAAIAGLLALLFILAMGFVRPNFTLRYTLGVVPPILLGVATWTAIWGKRWRPLPWMVVALLIATTARDLAVNFGRPDYRHGWSWEVASADLKDEGVRRVFYLWDAPTNAILSPAVLARVGTFFLLRENAPVEGVALRPGAGEDVDPNRLFLAMADRQGDAIIWAYDTWVARTLAIRHPPNIPALDPRWRCRSYERPNTTTAVYACFRPAEVDTSGQSQ